MASLNTFRLEVAKTKLVKISNKAEIKELAASNWISTTCRDIQTAIIKTCALIIYHMCIYHNRFALKCAFGKSYNDLYPGIIQFILRFPSMMFVSYHLLSY